MSAFDGAEAPIGASEQPSLEEWLRAEPFTLAMSSGYFGFFAHAGVLSALGERDLTPSATRGSSAGAMVTALWAAGLEPVQIGHELSQIKREDFWDPGLGFGLLKGQRFDNTLRRILPIAEISECAVPVRISVYDIFHRETEVLDDGDIALAIRASCARPGLFQPVMVNGRPKFDGGIKDHDGYAGAAADERIFHHRLIATRPKGSTAEPQPKVIAEHSNIRALEIDSLPRVSVRTLGAGRAAYELARLSTVQALDRPTDP